MMYRPCGRILLKVDKLGQGRLERKSETGITNLDGQRERE
jgi:hypothetical protein